MRELIDKFSKILNETNYDLLKNGEVDESGYASIMRGFRGLRENIKKIAILTAENPHGEQHSNEFNKDANFKLQKFLTEGKFSFKKIKGSYGQTENSFIVFNIPKTTAIYIGVKYNQDSIIYGEVKKTDKGNEKDTPMSFEMIGTDRSNPKEFGKVIGKTDVVIYRDNPEDFYSEVKGRKFVLPFYDVVDRLKGEDNKTYELTKNYDKSKWVGGKVEPTWQELKVVEEHLNHLQERVMNTSGSTAYNLRSRIRKIIG